MADSDKNILITPNTGETTEPTLTLTGQINDPITLRVLDDNTLSFEGSVGQLFSISPSLTGTIFSVNDISGIPSIEVDDTGEIRLAEFAGNVGIGKASPSYKLDVNGIVNASSFIGDISGNASSATKLETERTISLTGDVSGNGTFDGTDNVSIGVTVSNDSHTHAASNLTGTTLASDVVNSSLTSVGTISSGVWQGTAISDTYIASASSWNALETNITTNLSSTHNADNVAINSSDGTNATINTATTSTAGAMSSTLFDKLNGIEASANNYSHPTHPGDDFSVDTGVLSGAVVVSDIDINVTTDTEGHVTDTNGSISTRTLTKTDIGLGNVTNDAQIPLSQKGANSGVAELDSSGLVPSAQLPSYVDDVLEYANEAGFPATGETGKIYVALDVNKTFRWSGSSYTEISKSLALGETSTTAYRGDRGKIAYDHSQVAHAPSNAEQNVQSDWNATSGDAFIVNKPNVAYTSTIAADAFNSTEVGNLQANQLANGTTPWTSYLPLSGGTLTNNLTVATGVSNTGVIELDVSNAGSPQISLSDNGGDNYWAVGPDDADNNFSIHGSTSSMPTINNIADPFFEITTTGVIKNSGNIILNAATSFSGDVSGTYNSIVVADNSHNHTASNISDFDTEVANNSVVSANTAKVTNATHTGEVTGSSTLTISSDVVDADNLKVTGNGTTSQFLRSDADGTFTWATPSYYTDSDAVAAINQGDGIDYSSGTINVDTTVLRTATSSMSLGTFTSADDTDEVLVYDNGTAKLIDKSDLFSSFQDERYVFTVKREEFEASANQTVFNLANGSYITGANRASVYIWGVKQPNSAFSETDSTTVTLSEGVSAGTKVLIEYIQTVNIQDYIHASTHATGGIDEITPSDIGALSSSGGSLSGDVLMNGSNPMLRFVPSGANDGAGIRFNYTDNDGVLEFWTSDDYSEPFVWRAYDAGTIGSGTYQEWMKLDAGTLTIDGSIALRKADVDNTPENGVTDIPISSNWAYDHNVNSSAHHTRYADSEALAASVSGSITNGDTKAPSGDAIYAALMEYTFSPRFSTSIGMGNDTEILHFNDGTNETRTDYWSSIDGFEVRGDSNSMSNVVLKSGNLNITNNIWAENKVGAKQFHMQNSSDVDKAYMVYNETSETIDFNFV